MAMRCDWCKRQIKGGDDLKGAIGYTVEFLPFHNLNLGRNVNCGNRVVVNLHLHAVPCREAVGQALLGLVREHGPTDEEADWDRETGREGLDGENGDETPKRTAEERRWDEWGELPKHEQDRMVLETLGDNRLTNTEIRTRLQEGEGPCPFYYGGDVSIVTRRLYKAGELEREEGQFGACRVRYSRPKPSKELLKLDEQLTEGGES